MFKEIHFFNKCSTYNSVAFQIVNIWKFTLLENYCICRCIKFEL